MDVFYVHTFALIMGAGQWILILFYKHHTWILNPHFLIVAQYDTIVAIQHD